MTIETEYNIVDEVWFMENNKVCSIVIEAIKNALTKDDRYIEVEL